jgi:hypothetical protein
LGHPSPVLFAINWGRRNKDAHAVLPIRRFRTTDRERLQLCRPQCLSSTGLRHAFGDHRPSRSKTSKGILADRLRAYPAQAFEHKLSRQDLNVPGLPISYVQVRDREMNSIASFFLGRKGGRTRSLRSLRQTPHMRRENGIRTEEIANDIFKRTVKMFTWVSCADTAEMEVENCLCDSTPSGTPVRKMIERDPWVSIERIGSGK